jgi:hypothetical protein
MRIERIQAAAVLCAIVAGGSSYAAGSVWTASWASSPLGGKIVIPGVPREKIPPSLVVHGTLRYRLPLSQGGGRLLLRLSNEEGSQPLEIGAITVGIADQDLNVRPGTLRTVTFSGQPAILIPAAAPTVSDPVDMTTRSSDAVIVSIFLPKDTRPTRHTRPTYAGGWVIWRSG